MEIFTFAFWSSFLVIVGIDLFLAGDNAIVIALAAGHLPHEQRKKAVLYGTIGAIAIRILCTISVVYLLMVPGLHFIGGLLLIAIAYRLLVPQVKPAAQVKSATNIWSAIRTIIIADALMSLDNMLAVAGAAQSDPFLVIFGLLVSVPLLMGGSAIIMKLIDRYQWLIYVGAAILALTAGKMIFAEHFVHQFIPGTIAWIEWPIIILIIAAVLFFGYRGKQRVRTHEQTHQIV
ncbi:MAG: TerC family protein [Sporolactobacillus sp.]